MKKAIFPGTFDPFTIGHFSVVKRALTFMDEIIIGIGVNDSKRTWFPTERRVEMIRALYADSGVSVRYTISSTKRPLPTSTGNWQGLKPFCCLPSRS